MSDRYALPPVGEDEIEQESSSGSINWQPPKLSREEQIEAASEESKQAWAKFIAIVAGLFAVGAALIFIGAIGASIVNTWQINRSTTLGECGSLNSSAMLWYTVDPNVFTEQVSKHLVERGAKPGAIVPIKFMAVGDCMIAQFAEQTDFPYVHTIYFKFREGNLANVIDILHIESVQITEEILEQGPETLQLLPPGQ